MWASGTLSFKIPSPIPCPFSPPNLIESNETEDWNLSPFSGSKKDIKRFVIYPNFSGIAYSNKLIDTKKIVKKLKTTPNDEELLKLYGLYKQATEGNNNKPEPGFLDFKGKSKHAAWLKNKGKDTHDSEVEYITIVNNLITSYGINE